MRLALDAARLGPTLDEDALRRVVPDQRFRDEVRSSRGALPPSAGAEAAALERWVRSMSWDKVGVVVALGLGSGLLVDLVRQRSTARILVLEPRAAAVRAVLTGRSVRAEGVRVHQDVLALRADLRGHARYGLKLVLFAPPWAQRELAELVVPLRRAIDAAHRIAVINDNTCRRFTSDWMEMFLSALPSMVGRVPANRLPRALEGVPGVVVAAGPSLDENVEVLRRLEGRAALCAVNTSLPALDRAGIRPDLVAVVEQNPMVLRVLGSPSLGRAGLVLGPNAHKDLYGAPARAIYPAAFQIGAFGPWLTKALGVAPFGIGGSVAHLAWSALHHLGCDPIVLVGQDCALAGTRTHASGTPHGEGRVTLEANGLTRLERKVEDESEPTGFRTIQCQAKVRFKVPAWGGGEVETLPDLDLFRLWYEDVATALAGRIRLINATEGGARIDGFEELTLASFADELGGEGVDVMGRLETAAAKAEPIDGARLAAALESEAEACEAVRRKARRAAGLSEKLLERVRRGRLEGDVAARQLAELERLEAEIKTITPGATLLDGAVGPALQGITRAATREAEDDPGKATQVSLERSRQIFAEIDSTAATLGPELGRVADALDRHGRKPWA